MTHPFVVVEGTEAALSRIERERRTVQDARDKNRTKTQRRNIVNSELLFDAMCNLSIAWILRRRVQA